MTESALYVPPASRQELHSVLISPGFALAVGACLQHTMHTGNEGGFTLHRFHSGTRQGQVVNAQPLLPRSAAENGGADPTNTLMLPGVAAAIGTFHSHPYSSWFRIHSAWPSPCDVLNVAVHPDFGAGHVHGILGREETGTGSAARMHLLRVPEDAGDVSQAARSYAAFFAKAKQSTELGKYFSRFGIGHVALAVEVHNSRATFDYDRIGGIDTLLDQLSVND